MNKRFLALAMMLLLCMSVLLAGCKEKEAEATKPTHIGVEEDFFDEVEPTLQTEKDPTNATESTTGPTTATEGPKETNPVVTTPVQNETTAPTDQNDSAKDIAFETYLAMSGDEQRAFAKTFPSMDDFFLWYDKMAAQYDQKDVIEVTGPVDLGEFEN